MPYKDHHTLFGKVFGWFGDWIHDLVAGSNKDILEAVIKVTEGIKEVINNPLFDIEAALTKSGWDDKLLASVRPQLNVIMSDELLLQGITADTTQEEANATAQKIAESFGALPEDKKAKFYTSVGAQLYQLVLQAKSGKTVTFGQAASVIEYAYQAYLSSKA